ncbi:MarR family transcriptional regulator [Arthrobacter sp. 260]|uniref:MarR family winged helix-turn-helix transcriptional regulator n=1 Tax=Arthrobacter sp. 260 TaxID=2735314 RepID=UPI0014927570|nr:MarR family transcriptional regulator [Arthrobacter sp. 260]NOJ60894.1 MarR family transcriptional regulator [Arthrobacter sp. 260]
MAPPRASAQAECGHAPAPDRADGVQVLNILRSYHAAEKAQRDRMQGSMEMNDTDLSALAHLLQADHEDRTLRPIDLSRLLNISTASTTTLIDRLEKSGHLTRGAHPTDKRALVLIPTMGENTDVYRTFSVVYQRMLAVAQSLTPTEAETVSKFLGQMTAAIDTEGAPHSPA